MKLAEAVARIRDRISSYVRRPEVPLAPEQILGRHLGVAHLGRWVELPGKPNEPRVVNEPSLIAQGGRLVGFHADEEPARSPSTRVLVLLRGAPVEVRIRVDEPVLVSPREWS